VYGVRACANIVNLLLARAAGREWRRACCANAAIFSVKVTATNRRPGDDDFLKI
jgi:hypothetical protein